MRVASIATYSDRLDVLPDAVRSLAPQVDVVHVYYNGLPFLTNRVKISEILSEYKEYDKKVKIQFVEDQADLSKFRAIWDYPDATIFTCDDDLIYAPDYCYEMEKRLFHQHTIGTDIITVGGKIMDYTRLKKGLGFKRSISVNAHCLKVSGRGSDPVEIDIPLSGCSAFKASKFQDCEIDEKYKFAADIQLASWIADKGYTCRWLWGRFPNLLKYNEGMKGKDTIFDSYTSKQSELLGELALDALNLRD